MEISSICLSPVSTSIPRVTPPSLPFSSSNSTFFTSNATLTFFNKTKPNSNTLVLGGATTRIRVERARKGLTCNALFGLGVPELAVIAGVAALVFGPKKLPEVGKSIGKTVKSFQQAAKEFESELKKEPDSITEPPVEKPTAVSEEEKQDIKVSSTKESV
ncbi:sec-independent protein translocase protein TATA, chloroplastic [Quercus lobata]|uniref:sec-independent protein translocase protein TATA, chloroplastic-like n=1 Tax=Quercus lobata TaxID=97700 RepID=UPI001245EC83|nr:sec-independent protein translocase protein TATA, chloroplastic-like [Quercus lobata]XP_030960100.1 sec-independent protein translocase protein TATA, chloroplastic [Quercus lobata]